MIVTFLEISLTRSGMHPRFMDASAISIRGIRLLHPNVPVRRRSAHLERRAGRSGRLTASVIPFAQVPLRWDSAALIPSALNPTDTPATLESELEQLAGIRSGLVVSGGAQLCGDGSNQATTITFTDMGDVGDLTVTSSLASTGTLSIAPNKVQDGVSQVDEIQVIECTCPDTCSGSFYVSFRGYSSGAIPYDADATSIKNKLEEALTIHGVSVSLTGGTQACDNDGVDISVTFTHDSGDVPQLQLNAGTLAGGSTPTLTLKHSGQTSTQGVVTQTGTKEYVRGATIVACARKISERADVIAILHLATVRGGGSQERLRL